MLRYGCATRTYCTYMLGYLLHMLSYRVPEHDFGRTLLQRGQTDRVLSHRWIQSR